MHTIQCPGAAAMSAAGQMLEISSEPCAACRAAANPHASAGVVAALADIAATPAAPCHHEDYTENQDGDRTCTACGLSVEAEPEPAPEEEPSPYAQQVANERAQKRALSEAAARAIAAALTHVTGQAWIGHTPEDTYCPRALVTRTGDGLTVSVDYNANPSPHWRASLDYVTASDGAQLSIRGNRKRDEETGANIGATKDPGQIARDIARRLLPVAAEIIPRALATHAAELARDAWLASTVEAFTAAVPGLEETDRNRNESTRHLRRYGNPWLAIEIHGYDQTIKIEAHSLPPAHALAMLANFPTTKHEETTEEEG